ncbi:UDP-2,3-diacylglucosamine diphosphatase [Azospirillum brasilense]|nr:UDP-2,3-diacylglucosamine diphosphatase [Azospirillum brasilense]
MSASRDVKQYRSIWISDVHLGTRGCKAEYLLDFLKHNESDHLYLVGDIVDGWRLRKTWYWPQAHNDVVQKILRRARKGVQGYYIPGNHDEAARDYAGLQFGGVQVVEEMIHVTADGRRLLVPHGDRFDVVVKYARWLAFIGDNAYVVLLQANTLFNWVRRKLGFPYWSLSAFLKHKTKTAVEFIGNYETALGDEARRRKVDGVVCGHIHTAEIRDMEGIPHCNDGDWVESCTALVEHPCGRLEIIDWAADIRRRTATTLPARIPAKEKTEKEKAAKESVAA